VPCNAQSDLACGRDAGHGKPGTSFLIVPPHGGIAVPYCSDALDLHWRVWMSGMSTIDDLHGAECPGLKRGGRGSNSLETGFHHKRTFLLPCPYRRGAAVTSSLGPWARRSSFCSSLRRYSQKSDQTNRTIADPATSGGKFGSNRSRFSRARSLWSERSPQHTYFACFMPLLRALPGPGTRISRRFHGPNEGMKKCR